MPKRKELWVCIVCHAGEWPTMKKCAELLQELGVQHRFHFHVANAIYDVRSAEREGLGVLVIAAGEDEELAVQITRAAVVPVLVVPIVVSRAKAPRKLPSISRRAEDVPFGFFALGEAGAKNAALEAAAILALFDKSLGERLWAWRQALTESVLETVED